MNILVIGNGFDLAHGLPTNYGDFLFFCKILLKMAKSAKIENEIPKDYDAYDKWISMDKDNLAVHVFGLKVLDGDEWKIGKSDRDKDVYKDILFFCEKNFYADKPNMVKNILFFIHDNIWIEYFLQCNMYQKENWIDFESEISKIIQSLDNDMRWKSGKDFSFDETIGELSNEFLENRFSQYSFKINMIERYLGSKQKSDTCTFRQVRDILLNDLNKLIRALEIYLTEYVKNIDCKIISPDIQIISPKSVGVVYGIQAYDTYVLSFNYTNTYQRLYNNKDQPHIVLENFIDYIHGKAIAENNIDTNNMVLGIDEYLPDDRKDKDTDFIAFKKYYQRIYKGTGCEYKEWVDQIKESWKNETEESKEEIRKCISRGNLKNEKIHNLYIFGHSLDVTDKDVLRDLILNDNVHTTIFYHSKDELGRKIANLVKVIGQDELIRRTGGSTKTIDFKEQQKMQERD